VDVSDRREVVGDPTAPDGAARDQAALARVARWLRRAGNVVVLTGAGISTESGVPDFRGPKGVWTTNPGAEKTATLAHYVSDPEVRRRAWRARLESPVWRARPNAGHRALVDLERKGRLDTLVTQNIDGLHQAAGSSPEKVVEIHGTVHEATCLQCGWRGPMAGVLERVAAGEDDPSCRVCGGGLKSATISFGQDLVAADLERSQRAAAASDVFLALGTSLGVYPAAGLPEIARRAGARVVVANAEPTPFDVSADAVVRGTLGDALADLVARI